MNRSISRIIGHILRPKLCSYYSSITSNQSSQDRLQPRGKPPDQLLDPFSLVDGNDERISIYLHELGPPAKKGFNFAAYVNSAKSLQELVKLGVSLYDIENTNKTAAQKLLKLDFERDCLPHIKFLVDHGIKERNLGRFISEYPDIFGKSLDELTEVINYLKSVGFTDKHISRALDRSANLLKYNPKTIDFKLGEFQIEFNVPAEDLVKIVASYPQMLSFPKEQFRSIKFVIDEEFGFKLKEIQEILSGQPKILGFTRFTLIERLELVHNVIGLSHSTIVKFPKLITGPKLDITHRHEYLKKLNRNQYDPSKPLYVPPFALYKPSDLEFCLKYSKTSLKDYKLFLKSC